MAEQSLTGPANTSLEEEDGLTIGWVIKER